MSIPRGYGCGSWQPWDPYTLASLVSLNRFLTYLEICKGSEEPRVSWLILNGEGPVRRTLKPAGAWL